MIKIGDCDLAAGTQTQHPSTELAMAEKEKRKKLVIPDLYALRDKGEKISWLTAYDYPTALIMATPTPCRSPWTR
jgi:hypothetical protein